MARKQENIDGEFLKQFFPPPNLLLLLIYFSVSQNDEDNFLHNRILTL
jgi:hypothetical protein